MKYIAQRFEIKRHLGDGSLGKTFLAVDLLREQQVILKLVHQDLSEDIGGLNTLRPGLNRISSFSHPGLARLYDYGLDEGLIYLVIEKIDGFPVYRWILESTLPLKERGAKFNNFMFQVGEVLQELGKDQVHGNLHPNHIWICKDGSVKLEDHGFAQLIPIDKFKASSALKGHAGYLAPELFETDAKIQSTSDLFSLCRVWMNGLRQLNDRGSSNWIREVIDVEPGKRWDAYLRFNKSRSNTKTESPKKSWVGLNRYWILLLIACAVVGVVLGSIFLYRDQISSNQSRMYWQDKKGRLVGQIYIAQDRHLEALKAYMNWHPQNLNKTDINLIPFPHQKRIIELALELRALEETTQVVQTTAELELINQELQGLLDLVQLFKQTDLVITQLSEISVIRTVEPQINTNNLLDDFKALFQKPWIQNPLEYSDSLSEFHLTALSLRNHRLQLFYQNALNAQLEWKNELNSQDLPYIEPCFNLQNRLQQIRIGLDQKTVGLAEVEELDQISKIYRSWINEMNQIPDKDNEEIRVNSIGMRFVRMDDLWVSQWETRNIDFARFVESTGKDMRRLWRERAEASGITHPVVNVSVMDARDFCDWLTVTELNAGLIETNQKYRLPGDFEWSRMVGLDQESDVFPVSERGWDSGLVFPWDLKVVQPNQRGNYYTWPNANPDNDFLKTMDPFYGTAPVGSFPANKLGIFDLGGNVWEWVDDSPLTVSPKQSLEWVASRGGGWRTMGEDEMRSGYRLGFDRDHEEIGFRIVLSAVREE